jgi:hypothetical protein
LYNNVGEDGSYFLSRSTLPEAARLGRRTITDPHSNRAPDTARSAVP